MYEHIIKEKIVYCTERSWRITESNRKQIEALDTDEFMRNRLAISQSRWEWAVLQRLPLNESSCYGLPTCKESRTYNWPKKVIQWVLQNKKRERPKKTWKEGSNEAQRLYVCGYHRVLKKLIHIVGCSIRNTYGVQQKIINLKN